MSKYIYAPAGPSVLESITLMKCVEYIGRMQTGSGSNLSKGKRYLKSKLGCSGKAIKRALQRRPKVMNHDFQEYGLDVYFYHTEFCTRIVQEIIRYVKEYSSDDMKKDIFGSVPKEDEYVDLLYGHRIAQLYWVQAENYKEQGERAADLIDSFSAI